MASSSNFPNPFSSSPFTLNTDIGTSSLAAMFTTMSNNDLPTSLMDSIQSSLQASLKSKFSGTTGASTLVTSTIPVGSSASTAASAAPSAAAAASAAASSNAESTSAASSQLETGTNTASAAAASSTLTSATSAVPNNATTSADSTTGGAGMSPGIKAAIAVPVVVIALVALIIALLCARRRKRKRPEEGELAEKVPLAQRKKNWTRHLRIFSFDTELLMGGRYSSNNSLRSGQTSSLRSRASDQSSQAASVHSTEEVAPPYRDAISSAHQPSIGQVMATPAALPALLTAGVSRSASNATAGTAPPPYRSGAMNLSPTHPGTPTSARGRRNPFADSTPVSPVEISPFNDPPSTSPALSRNSSLYHTDRDETSTIGGASDAASIREATVARNASVMSGGRIINNGHKS